MKGKEKQKGFTLLEVLLVVAIIAILAGIVIIALNPGKQLSQSKDAQRAMDVNTILNAVYQYSLDNNGDLPASITATETEICKTGTLAATCVDDELIDLSVLTTDEEYLTSLPTDPNGSTEANGTGYVISKTGNNRVTVSAPGTEIGADINVKR